MKRYSIIYADPPWTYNDRKGNNPALGGITYPTMSLDAIKALSVKQIADKNSILFLWVTMPMLKEGLEVISAWGFKYITCAFVWIKLNPSGMGIYSGLGHWVNGNAELCLLAKNGHPRRIAKNIKQIVLSPRREHSRKPDEVRDRIVQLMGDLPRIELFARQKVEGWDCWGNEVESDIELLPSQPLK